MTAMERIAQLERRVAELERDLVLARLGFYTERERAFSIEPHRDDVWRQYDYAANAPNPVTESADIS